MSCCLRRKVPDTTVVERLAVELHRQYRAAETALNGPDRTDTVPALKDGVTLRHDHGWEGCHRQKYFLKRAGRVIRYSRIQNADTLSWSVKTDAQLKAERDALVRKTLWGKKPKYTLTAQ